MLLWLALLTAPSADDGLRDRSLLGPGGLVAPQRHVVLATADTELTGYPTAYVGWRMGVLPWLDVGVAAGGNDKAQLGRVQAGFRFWQGAEDHLFLGARLRLEWKHHEQTFPAGEFRPIDDLGLVVAPELGFGARFGRRDTHVVHAYGYWYGDVDVRGLPFEHYGIPIGLGYELSMAAGFHLVLDAAVGWELGNPTTAGFLIPRARLILGWRI